MKDAEMLVSCCWSLPVCPDPLATIACQMKSHPPCAFEESPGQPESRDLQDL